MRKKNKHPEHENLERWLVSYADFITLLFATFVVLYALSQLDLAKFKLLKSSLQQAFSSQSIIQGNNGIMENSGSSILSGQYDEFNVVPPVVEEAEAKYEEKDFSESGNQLNELEKTNQINGVEVRITDRGLEISLLDALFFDSGSAKIKKSVYPTLSKIGKMLKDKYTNHPIRVEGHTDNIPIKSPIYPSNWELSSARACSVVRFFINNLAFPKNRFAAIGYADVSPLASNNTEKGKNRNRRVDIIVLRNKLIKGEHKIAGFNKIRIKAVKDQLAEEQKITKEKHEKKKISSMYNTGISDAAVNLIYDTGKAVKNMILYQDKYDKENDKLDKELKQMEQNAKNTEAPKN